jgi:hypothetical protein
VLTGRVTRIDVEGSLPHSVVKRGLDRVAEGMQRCKATGGPVTALVHFTIDESRRARDVRGSGAPASVIGCVAAVLGRMRTDSAPDVGDVQVTLLIAFEVRP